MGLHSDLMATVDVAGNSVTAAYTYSEFGAAETGDPDLYGWAASSEKAATGVAGQILMGLRGYDPKTGRFNSVDSQLGGG